MVRSIIIPHDRTKLACVCELADLGAFQAAVDGSLEPLEIPALGATVYMNEGAAGSICPSTSALRRCGGTAAPSQRSTR